MKILVYSPPFSGHLNVLKKMMELHKEIDYKLVITGWNNLPVEGASNLARSTLKETDPALWTFPRVLELMDDSLDIAREYMPDLIIYDFFSLEGHFAGKLLGIPAWCSIPAMIGPNDKGKYLEGKLSQHENLKAIVKLRDKYGLEIGNIEMISDGLHLPSQVNLIWSYNELIPPSFMDCRKDATYFFIGNPNARIRQNKEVIYFSFGSVVMGNLWDQQEETRAAVRDYTAGVAEGLKDEKVVFATQGKSVLGKYPESWQAENRVNQVEMLSRSRAFITHGGSNSFHEAILQKTPMVVVPFFGDQIIVGQRAEELGIGINLGRDNSIDTKKPKNFLNMELAGRTVEAVIDVLYNPHYQKNIEKLKLTSVSLIDIIRKYFP